jgi:hypothetical protein
MPPPELLYAQVVTHREPGKVAAVTTKTVFGTEEAVQARVAASLTRRTINTLRQHNRRLTRKTTGFSKELVWFEKQVWLALADYHLVVPHISLRRRLSVPEPMRGSGSARRWMVQTPAMAAGLTDHVWTTTEALSYRVPVTFLDTLHTLAHVFPPFEAVHQGS